MQVDDFSQYTDEEIERMKDLVRVEDHVFGPGPANRQERRKQATGNGRRKGRNLGGAKVKR